MRRRRLEIEDGPLSLPLGEISGVCQAYGTQRQELRLLAIGDDSPIVIAVDIEPGPNGRPVPNDLTTVLSASTVPIGNWEAIATDGDASSFCRKTPVPSSFWTPIFSNFCIPCTSM